MDFIRNYAAEFLQVMQASKETDSEYIARKIKEQEPIWARQRVGQSYYDNDTLSVLTWPVPKTPEGILDKDKPDNRIISNFHGNQVDHKVNYLLAEPINFKADDATIKVIDKAFGLKFDDMLIDTLIAASNKGIEWIHAYYNDKSELKFKRIPAEQIVPVYDEEDNLVLIIRTYKLDNVERAEVWTLDGVNYYMKQDADWVADYYWGEAETTHHSNGNWDAIPFVPFRNNSQEEGDIWKYKTVIDAFNRQLSNMQNLFDETAEIVFVLRGYQGQDLSEFKRNLKHYGAINVEADPSSGVDTLTVKLPVEETKVYLKELREMIIDFGQGVDFTSDRFGNSPSGVALKVLFAALDMKAKALERKTRVGIEQLLYFVFDDAGIKTKPEDVEMTFQYNRLTNDLEDSQIALNSKGIISDLTIMANHPWTDDVQGEMERLQEQELEFAPLPENDEGDVNNGSAAN
ncbi:phage portal protein [Macrococcus capreoli]|uniref:phage portal protein n=1 Tax=Macrococcus capreoli TaxID=2982690 RepID=UPI003EE69A00